MFTSPVSVHVRVCVWSMCTFNEQKGKLVHPEYTVSSLNISSVSQLHSNWLCESEMKYEVAVEANHCEINFMGNLLRSLSAEANNEIIWLINSEKSSDFFSGTLK